MATEKRLIDANALVDKLYDNEFATLCPLDEVCGVIDSVETVDAVEVVRCKDCLWSYRVDCREPRYACRNICRFGCSQWLDSNDFCSYGERRTDGNS